MLVCASSCSVLRQSNPLASCSECLALLSLSNYGEQFPSYLGSLQKLSSYVSLCYITIRFVVGSLERSEKSRSSCTMAEKPLMLLFSFAPRISSVSHYRLNSFVFLTTVPPTGDWDVTNGTNFVSQEDDGAIDVLQYTYYQ